MTADDTLHEVLMPRVSDTMTEGILAKWLKTEGDDVVEGEPLAEIETDKATVELAAPASGVLLQRVVDEGGVSAPGAVVALVGPRGAVLPEPAGKREQSAEAPRSDPTTEPGRASSSTRPAAPKPPPIAAGDRIRASPLAKRIASEEGVDLTSLVPGSGRNGRILRQDVERAMAAPRAGSPATPDRVLAPTRLQQIIARRMTAAKRDVPHYYVDDTANVTDLLALRAEARAQGSPLAVPVTAYVMRAIALALRRFSRVNASWTDEGVVVRSAINVGLAVAVDDEGLVVPVIQSADVKSVAELAAESAELISRARAGQLTHADMSGGSFTISNLGMFGIETFHAVINPPESGILAVGGIRREPRFAGEEVVAHDLMRLSLSADHRVYSGATAAAFLADVRASLERPLRLL